MLMINKNRIRLTIGLMIAFTVCLTLNIDIAIADELEKPSLRILFTHDLHSNLEPDNQQRGGFASIYTIIQQYREVEGEILLLDAGDFSIGTLYQAIFTEEAPELRLMGSMGYDAVTLGNHEFDFRSEGLRKMLLAAISSREPLPPLLCGNINWPASRADQINGTDAEALEQAMDRYGVTRYILLEKNGLSIAVFGLMGVEAASMAPTSGLIFHDPIERAKSIVKELQSREEPPDLIVCLSHSGTKADIMASEDELLADAVPEIDLIISGHTHTVLSEPIILGNTIIASAGQYGTHLGSLKLGWDTDTKRWRCEDYQLLPVDESIPADATLQESIDNFKKRVQRLYLNNYGYRFDQVLAYSPFAFTPIEEFATEHREDFLGNLISDSYIYAIQKLEGEDGIPVDVAVVPAGVVRDSIDEGEITVAQAFKVSSMGSGDDGQAGFPLVSIWLTGADLKILAELDASVSRLMPEAQLYCSGISYTFNPNRLLLNRVTDIKLRLPNGFYQPIDDDRLYRIVSGLYSIQMLTQVESRSFGLLSLTPRDQNGNPIDDFSPHIIHNNNGQELKEWIALASYLESLPLQEGIATIPSYYQSAQGRKTIDDSQNLTDLVKNPNKIAFMLMAAIAIALLLIVLIIWFIVRKLRKVKKGYNS